MEAYTRLYSVYDVKTFADLILEMDAQVFKTVEDVEVTKARLNKLRQTKET